MSGNDPTRPTPRSRWLGIIVLGLITAFVLGASIAQAIRDGSMDPIWSIGWLPAVLVAARPGAVRSCARRRYQP